MNQLAPISGPQAVEATRASLIVPVLIADVGERAVVRFFAWCASHTSPALQGRVCAAKNSIKTMRNLKKNWLKKRT